VGRYGIVLNYLHKRRTAYLLAFLTACLCGVWLLSIWRMVGICIPFFQRYSSLFVVRGSFVLSVNDDLGLRPFAIWTPCSWNTYTGWNVPQFVFDDSAVLCAFPAWLFVFFCLIIVMLCFRYQRDRGLQQGRCQQCGYDVRSIVGEKCPECGYTVTTGKNLRTRIGRRS
jgi:hypothetical protein